MQGVNNETAWLNSTYILTIHHSNTIFIFRHKNCMQHRTTALTARTNDCAVATATTRIRNVCVVSS